MHIAANTLSDILHVTLLQEFKGLIFMLAQGTKRSGAPSSQPVLIPRMSNTDALLHPSASESDAQGTL